MKFLSIVFFFLSFLFGIEVVAQSQTFNSDSEPKVRPSIKPAYELWSSFLKSKADSIGAAYWNKEELKNYGSQDYFLIEKVFDFGFGDLLYFWNKHAHIHTFSISENDGLFKIKAGMYFNKKSKTDSTKTEPNYMYLFHVYAKEEQGRLKLFNAFEINKVKNCEYREEGFIKYYFPKGTYFERQDAIRQNNFLVQLCAEYGVTPDTVEYVYANSQEALNRINGFDFKLGDSGKNIPSGFADDKNKRVMCQGTGTYYPHELVHVFLNPVFPNSHLWFNEGLATYYGGSRGKSLDWHIQQAHHYLKDNDSINLSNMMDYVNMTEYTEYRYVLGGLLMKMTMEKGGVHLVKKMMSAGNSDSAFYGAIEQYLNIKREDLNEVLRDRLKKEYKAKTNPIYVHGNDTFYNSTDYIEAVLGFGDTSIRSWSTASSISSNDIVRDVFKKYYIELINSINFFKMPYFLLDQNFDYRDDIRRYNRSICSYDNKSFRYDLINSLSKSQLHTLLKIIEVYNYKKVLQIKYKISSINESVLPYSEYSTWQIIKAAAEGKKLKSKYRGT